ncbi:MAG TPA: hypothetical protein VF250_09980 [Conexibacter sp.]
MERWREAAGQATSEYVALVALVALTLALAAGLTAGGLGGQLLAGLQRGLCNVADVRCPGPQRPRDELDPCPANRREREEQAGGTIAVVRLGRSGTLDLVYASDGSASVTLSQGTDVGLEASAGARVRLGSRTLGGHATAGGGVVWASGRSWHFPDDASARRFIDEYGSKATIGGQLVDEARSACSLLCDAIGWRPHAELPEPDERYAEGGLASRLTAAFGSAQGSLAAGAMLGRRRVRDGSTTWYVRLGAQATAGLALPGAGLGADIDGEAVLGYELDAARRPRALHVSVSGTLSAAAELALGRARASAAAGGGAMVELDATLDLHDAANRVAAAGVLDGLESSAALVGLPARARALGKRIAQDAQIDRRTYVVRRDATGVGAGAGLGVKIDGGFERTTTVLHLVDAETRLPGLPFLPRDDCRAG